MPRNTRSPDTSNAQTARAHQAFSQPGEQLRSWRSGHTRALLDLASRHPGIEAAERENLAKIVRIDAEARTNTEERWFGMMADFGVTRDGKDAARIKAKEHPDYGAYLEACNDRNSAVQLIDFDRARYAAHLHV